MLSTTTMTTVLPVKDMDRARAFYRDSLGLKPAGSNGDDSMMFSSGGSNAVELIVRPDANTWTTLRSASKWPIWNPKCLTWLARASTSPIMTCRV